jgi:alkylation response protein AidB-like acyl-CoA dehydrogenase
MSIPTERKMLQEIAERYLRDRYDFRERTRIVGSVNGYDSKRWRDFAQMGWLGLPFPEEYGGTGGTMSDVMVLMKAFGRSLVVEPFLSSVVLGGMTMLAAGTLEQKKQIIPQITSGSMQVAFGFAEPEAGYDSCDISTTAIRQGDRFCLNGRKAVVLGASSADLIIVSARSDGGRCDHQGISLFMVERSALGLALRGYQTIDGRRAAEVTLDDVLLDVDHVIGQIGFAGPVIEQTLMAGRLCTLGHAVGALAGSVERTIDYLTTREQFGRKLASYQALRHRVADMYVTVREAEALAELAAEAFMAGPNTDSAAIISGAKAYIAEEGRAVAENAVQLHGAIAITDEYIVGHYLKSIVAIDRLFGDVEFNLDVFMQRILA